MSSEKLLEKLDESVSCRFCQVRVQVMENVATKHGLGSTWRIQCENDSCPSHKKNSVFNSSEKSRAFEIYRASVLGLRAIGGGHSAPSKFFSFLGLAPSTKTTWGTIYAQVFSVSFRVSLLQGLQPSGELGTSCTVREIVETLKWKLFHSRLDIIFSILWAILEWSSLLNIEAPCIKEIRLQTNGEFGELQSLFACSQVKFTSSLHDLCHG